MAGCECWDWKMAVDSKDIVADETLGDYMAWFIGLPIKKKAQTRLRYCPFCGAKLTPPEEAGDEAE